MVFISQYHFVYYKTTDTKFGRIIMLPMQKKDYSRLKFPKIMLRKDELNISVDKLAQKMVTSRDNIYKLVKGERPMTVDWLNKFAKALQCEVSFIIDESFISNDIRTIDRALLKESLDAIEKVAKLKNLPISRQEILEKGVELYEKVMEYKNRGVEVEISPVIAELILNQK